MDEDSPVVNGQNQRSRRKPYASPANAPYAATSQTSRRPEAGGRHPASSPTQAAPSIWNGSQGPTPPVTSAEAKSVTAPSTKPKPRPSARPPRTMSRNTGEKPVTPPPSGLSAAPTEASTPSMAIALASSPPSATSARTI